MQIERNQRFKKGARVTYTGTITPSLQGVSGTVQGYDHSGWCIVDFDDGNLDAPIYDENLSEEVK